MTEKEDGGGVVDQKGNTGNTSSEPCPCKCEVRLKTLEDEIHDLKEWKVQIDKFQRLLSQVEKLLAVKKSSAGAPPAATKTEAVSRPCSDSVPPPPQVPEPPPESKRDASPVDPDELPPIDDSNGIENVEITPDVFGGHFLLGEGDDEEPMTHHNMSLDEFDDDDDDDFDDDDDIEEIEVPSKVEVLIPSSSSFDPSRKRRRDEEESDSEDVYTLTDDSDDSDSDDEEYIPAGKRGRGRGRGTVIQVSGPPPTHPSSMKGTQALDSQTRLELIRHCRKRPGEIWECNVCGFMLTSLDNMLLHVKYNHSTSTHTCPFCKVVVLCRSPKDAVMHQVQCNMRPQGAHCRTPSNSFNRLANNNTTPQVVKPSPAPVPPAKSKPPHMSVDDKVNKFVSDLLDAPMPKKSTSSSSDSKTTNKAGGRGRGVRKPVAANNKVTRSSRRRNCGPPVTVTLSSDDDEDSSD